MARHYLEFEKPIQDFEDKIMKLQSLENDEVNPLELKKLIDRRDKKIDEIYGSLNRWQRVQLARHPERPFSLDYINGITEEFIELHGDRTFADDKALIGGIGKINDRSILFIGQQKGRNTKDNLYRNFGMMRPEGYRKAMRLMRLAEKFDLPVVSLIDTPGAYPGLGAEERGQGEAIARNLMEMAKLNVPILAIVIGEGASGGALGIGLCDRLIMLENTWYSVISPEGCASILWHDAMKASDAADAMKVTPKDLEEIGICDRIINEPTGGAHREPEQMNQILKKIILEELDLIVDQNDNKDYLQSRIKRYEAMGRFQEN
ncbi:MAG: acetyl-CoA carboxylase carboxyltransferase subunit alpha [Candidatus Neomarinimicrobiota bacterium]|nr:acetyl-CoA carboxylase carboxyltransferase subunit alpha [Candidatus Neomarinimicrobiota bacterium]MED5267055.1 acetyl-CoA carboxylase carboxyltransferase subunit alpha [Candidatus Neomarinimicrobiota bacterium]|tara:strand:- start:1314 stop:2270 length:957 start_codon:yes stop_codon:yes gene_type:complete